jgi:hypothetical protein
MKTSELTGAALDWAVAKCNGKTLHYFVDDPFKKDPWLTVDGNADQPLHSYTPSTDWAQAGPVIEREEISVSREFASSRIEWAAWTPAPIRDESEAFGYGPTPLIAAMRCYVASKLGDEIETPEELK